MNHMKANLSKLVQTDKVRSSPKNIVGTEKHAEQLKLHPGHVTIINVGFKWKLALIRVSNIIFLFRM